MKKITVLIATSTLLLPMVTFAQAGGGGAGGGINGLLVLAHNIINALVPIVIAIAVLYFLWGLVSYLLSAGEAEKRSEARQVMIWGVIIIFVMVSVWGLVKILSDSLNLTNDAAEAPAVPGQRTF